MELDLRFKHYELKNEQLKEAEEVLDSVQPSKPYQEILDFLENNQALFVYKEFLSVVKNVQGVVHLNLKDGSTVKLAVREGIVNLGIIYPDNSKFVATWSNIQDEAEFIEKCRNLK